MDTLDNTELENNSSQENQETEDALQWRTILDIIIVKRWWIVLSVICFMVIAALYLQHASRTYSRSTTILIKDDEKGESAMNSVSSELSDLGMFSSKSNVNDEMQALQSPYLMYLVIKQLKLNISYTEHQFLRDDELYKTTPISATFAKSEDDDVFSFKVKILSADKYELSEFVKFDKKEEKPVKIKSKMEVRAYQNVNTPIGQVVITPSSTFKTDDIDREIGISKTDANKLADGYCKSLNIELADKKASVLTLSYTDLSTQKAEDVLNTLLDIYSRERIEDKKQSAINTSKFINGRLLIIEQELGGIDNNIEQYKSSQLLTNVQLEGANCLQESNEYSGKALDISNQLAIAKYIKQVLDAPEDKPSMLPANSGLTDNGVSTQITSYNDMVMKRDRLIANSSTRNPLVVELDYSLKGMRNSIDKSLANLIHSYTLQANSLRGKEGQIHQKIAENPKQEKYLLSIGRQQKIKESLYLYLLQKREENELSGSLMVSNIRMITPPRGEDKPISPKKKQILAIAFLLGFAFPVGIFWLLDTMDGTIRGKKDLEKLSIPYLGSIPLTAKIQEKSKLPLPVVIVVEDKKRDFANEAFRVLRTNFTFMAASDKDTKIIMYTSFFQNSGKTFVATNLGMSVALTNKKVLLIDMDMRKGELSNRFGSCRSGVSTYLSNQDNDIDNLIIPTRLNPNLDILPCGVLPPNPSELLLTERLKMLIEAVRSRYDYVFVDCTPLNVVADASIVGKLADLVLFIVREGKFERSALPELERLYKSKQFKHMACILNGARSMGSYGSDGTYHRYGTYGSYGYGSYGSYGYGSYGANSKVEENEDNENKN